MIKAVSWNRIFRRHLGHILPKHIFNVVKKSLNLSLTNRPTVEILYSLGIQIDQFYKLRMFDSEKYVISVSKMETKLGYLHERMSMSNFEIRILIKKFNRILEYNPGRIENGLLLCAFNKSSKL